MMSLLQTTGLEKRIGDRLLFTNVTLNINRGSKLAIVGVNGCGKSSLLDIIAGYEKADDGTVTKARDIRISYLKQEPELSATNSILDELFSSGTPVTDTIRDYEKSLFSGDDSLVQRMIIRMDELKAWDYEVAARQILTRLKLTNLDSPVSSLSGGERKRVALARALVEEFDILILDEPTNHLDIDMIEWLEDYLAENVRTLLMVTHDRYFLDRICTGILELTGSRLDQYDGSYSSYLARREQADEARRSSTEKANNLLRKELEWIRRMPKARRHKSKSRIDSFHELEEKAKGQATEKSITISLDQARIGNKVLEIDNLSKTYGGRILIHNFSYKFSRFEKAGIIGPNGSGKSTLFNIISGIVNPDNGRVVTGPTVKLGYYRQEGISFDQDKTVLDAASEIAESVTLSDGKAVTVSSFLNQFLFPPDRQRTVIRKLSGGEKRRLYLLTVLMNNPNFLILDEPTNDLDILTLNVLEEYLSDFRGCLLIASHDRFFLDKIVTHVFEIRDNGAIADFPGTYSRLRENRESEENSLKAEKNSKQQMASGVTAVAAAGQEQARQKLTWKEKKEMEETEAKLEGLNLEKQSIESDLASSSLSEDDIRSRSSRYSELLVLIEDLELRWLELAEKQESLKKQGT